MRKLAALASVGALLVARGARAADAITLGQPKLDPPTLVALGVVLPITNDDNHNAKATLRYRAAGATAWRDALPLYRVRPETVPPGWTPAPQLAGSVFDLIPDTSYELEIHVTDPDGPVDQTLTLMGRTRAVPRDPKTPRAVPVANAQALKAALAAAAPGDVITLAPGTYAGNFSLSASGSADQPIVIRGQNASTVVLDGGGCTGCNVFEAYGSYVHLEKLTVQNASRAIRFQSAGTQGNVVRRVHVRDVTLGIGSSPNQRDFVIADNVLEGRLAWPAVYTDDGGAHANDDGVHVEGFGHVVAHNSIKGFGDAMKTEQDGARAVDFYGNEVLTAYDNGVELDGAEGNVRLFANRFTNTYATISVQPVYGGPAYVLRNVVVNVVNEQMKFHGLGNNDGPSGVLVYHNTFVSPVKALGNYTSAASHHFAMQNNLFIGPASPPGRVLEWEAPIDDGLFDYDGIFPDGSMRWNVLGMGNQTYASLAQAQAAGWETHGRVLAPPIFAASVAPPASYTTEVAPADVTLAASSGAIDHGVALPNVNDAARGAPDLGALELGCKAPAYGPRPDGVDETNEGPLVQTCGSVTPPGSDGGATGSDGGAGADAGGDVYVNRGGCGCNAASPSDGGAAIGALVGALAFLRRRRR